MICISPTLGDIVIVHSINNQNNNNNQNNDQNNINNQNINNNTNNNCNSIINDDDIVVIPQTVPPDVCYEVTEENLDDFVNVSINNTNNNDDDVVVGKSILCLYSINGRYIQHLVHEERILAICYSNVKEGIGINVIATAMDDGIIRLWNSWNLNLVTELNTGLQNIKRYEGGGEGAGYFINKL